MMDVVVSIGLALLVGVPWARRALRQPAATPSGYRQSTPPTAGVHASTTTRSATT